VDDYMRQAVALSRKEVARGGIPFAGIVAHAELGILGSGVNRVLADRDPSAHAEIVALRHAADHFDQATVSDSALFASGEPCGMCYQAAFEAGVSVILYAVDAEGAARHGFDYRRSYLALDRTRQGTVTHRLWPIEESLTPFAAWLGRHG